MDNFSITKVVNFLRHLGLDREQADAYCFLLSNGPSTVLAISRGIDTGRTKLYPALNKLVDLQIVKARERHYGTTYEALPPENLKFIVDTKERELFDLKSGLNSNIHTLTSLAASSPSTSRLTELADGIDTLKQIYWNAVSNASNSLKIIRYKKLTKVPGINGQFETKLRNALATNRVNCFIISNEASKENQDQSDFVEHRMIDATLYPIESDILIYKNNIALVDYSRDNIAGIEIQSTLLAHEQEKLFDVLWTIAKQNAKDR